MLPQFRLSRLDDGKVKTRLSTNHCYFGVLEGWQVISQEHRGYGSWSLDDVVGHMGTWALAA